jgi:hypothetical protein
VRNRVIGERELPDAVRVAVEREQAARIERPRRQFVIDVLPVPVAVDLDRDAACRGLTKDPSPIRRDAGAGVVHPPLRMPENRDAWLLDGGEHARRLIVVLAQRRVR